LKRERANGLRSTACEARTPRIAVRMAYSQPKRIWLATTKTKASETTRSFSMSSGTGFMSARSARPKKRTTPTPVEASGGSKATPTAAPAATGSATPRTAAMYQ
jgi:hypothetical protein